MWSDYKNYKRRPGPPKFFFFLLVAAVFVAIFSGIVMWLWNAILPELVGVNPIRFWEATGLLILCRILFGGLPFKSFPKHVAEKRAYWREKWINMSDEDKIQFKEKWKDWCKHRENRC